MFVNEQHKHKRRHIHKQGVPVAAGPHGFCLQRVCLCRGVGRGERLVVPMSVWVYAGSMLGSTLLHVVAALRCLGLRLLDVSVYAG